MLAHLIAFGLIATASEAIEPGTGVVSAPSGMTALVKPTTASGGTTTGIPLPAIVITQPIDPSDETMIAFDFSPWLAEGEKIATIEVATPLAGGFALGVAVDVRTSPDDRRPLIDVDGKKIGVFLLIDDASRNNAAFSGTGAKVGIAARIRTSAVPYRIYERTAVVTVQQQ